MNQSQKMILVAVILIISGMLIYPPFQAIRKDGVLNLGYSWFFAPPHQIAIVNIGMLLIQWIGILIVGCIAFFLAKTSK